MEPNSYYLLTSLLFCAFFSIVELAFSNSNKHQIDADKNQVHRSSSIIALFDRNPAQFIATMLVGNGLALVVYAYLMAVQSKSFISRYITQPEAGVVIIQILLTSLLILIFVELLPRVFYWTNPNKILFIFAIPVFILYFLLYPVAKFILILSSLLLKLFFNLKINSKEGKAILGMIDHEYNNQKMDEVETETEIEHDIKLFQNAVDFSKVKLRECTVPRNEIAAVELNSPVEKLKEKFIETGYSKILIYKESIDHIIGYAQSSDLFQNPGNISSMIKNLIIVPESMSANKLLNVFMKEHKSIALIVDEFGGTAGIVTIEDIMEEIFGEIEDEHDSTDFREEKLSDSEFIFSGRLEIDYINEKFNIEIPESEDYVTIAGFILHHNEEIPSENEIVIINNFEFEILKMYTPKIELVKLKIKTKR